MREDIPPTPFKKDDGESVERRFLDYFALSEQPFGVTPDPRFLYLGPKHRQALTALAYGTDLNRGFLTLIAPPGMGKTSLLYQYLEGLRDKARTAFLFQTDGDSRDLMRHLLADLDLDSEGKDLPEMRLILNQFLLQEMNAGRSFVLVIDEAQNLDEKVLESVRLLSNFETPWMKLMQIILAGQPQLAERLAKPEMAQLRQRVSFSIRIEPLTREEVTAYVDHRLWVAGYKSSTLFSVGARTLLADYSQGIPRNINNICFSAMSLAWALKQKNIDRDMMRDVLSDMDFEVPKEKEESAPTITEQPKAVAKAVAKPVVKTVAKPAASQNVYPAVLTLKEPPSRSKLAKAAFAGLLLATLGWAGIHVGIDKQLDTSWRTIATVIKSYLAPAAAPAPLNTIAPASFDSLSADPKSAPPTDDKNPGAREPGNAQSTLPGREAN